MEMNFVISDVMTVTEEEFFKGDPLREAKMGSQLTSRSHPGTRRIRRYAKNCFVPECPNTTKSTPEKMFVAVPVNPARRKVWFEAVGKPLLSKNPKTPFHCCQDHFNLPREMVNYQQYQMLGNKANMSIARDVVPSIFLCKQFTDLPRRERIHVLRNLHKNHSVAVAKRNSPEPAIGLDLSSPTNKTGPPRRTFSSVYSKKMTNRNGTPPAPLPPSSVFIKMPVFENVDRPDYITLKNTFASPKTEEVIVIDDSDAE